MKIIPPARYLSCLILILLLQACASGITIIDTAGVDEEQLERDMEACESLADELDNSNKVTESALLGAFFSGLTEFVFSGGNEEFAREAAFVGAIQGGIAGATELEYEKDEVVKNCMHNRGYAVLN